jgi:hypothetical protein
MMTLWPRRQRDQQVWLGVEAVNYLGVHVGEKFREGADRCPIS